MTQNEVLKELRSVIADNQNFTTWTVSTPHLVELVSRAIKAEREACAKVCDELYAEDETVSVGECVNAIRARGDKA